MFSLSGLSIHHARLADYWQAIGLFQSTLDALRTDCRKAKKQIQNFKRSIANGTFPNARTS
jgi:hypothetical protein